ncbi:hypothetical protein AGABI1DRAFT_77113 [Agaricus bisporus var. burnettii JB137-S8]|uniref:Cupin type-1 domain-containing protein n=1 Tax=Agaricus bisporus var. burnettii (strain JB137-S8 / ATCC MYA-4627 / FGSC 10392) TaxID=597362 RepID=K5X393_AGABU|nr:uncharacterized protein AGABI1DRAFT_77113 [Agaricus bisporus var. burnettii JB137-S8]EKM77608.1 hypothetical protein AGABI1DRAFT_77113 [Agaricus bisporus var. burnettii JB137-S8]
MDYPRIYKPDSDSDDTTPAFISRDRRPDRYYDKPEPVSATSDDDLFNFHPLRPPFQARDQKRANGIQTTTPQPVRGKYGAPLLGPENVALVEQNLDLLRPPKTDSGSVMNFKWPFSFSHNRLTEGGWARHQNEKQMPIAKDLAAVNMRLKAGAIREMHWHVTNEWAYVLKGSLRVSVLAPGGENEGVMYVADVNEGDLWYFPAGDPHSLQAKDTNPEGAEFLLIFDSGAFDENETFLLTDWLVHVPKEVLAKNFQTYPDTTPFDHIPEEELYIFPSTPPSEDINKELVVPNPTDPKYFFAYPFSKVEPIKYPGGTVKVADSRSFEASKNIAVAEVEVEVGGIRYWHPTQPEWTFILSGKARITLFASQHNAATYDFFAGDVAYIPPTFGHYVENIGDEPLKFLEVLKTDVFQDISLRQWLALTPHNVVKAHLGFSEQFIDTLPREKQVIVSGEQADWSSDEETM